MGRKRKGGFLFIWWDGDHAPRHVHVHDQNGRFLGRVRLDNLAPLDEWQPSREVLRLIQAMLDQGEI
jgi:hypothetical protein